MAGDAAGLLDDLAGVTGAEHVLVDPEVTGPYCVDWTGRWHGACRAVVRPGSTAEVVDVVARCAVEGVAIVPQGGNTGLVGATVPGTDQIVLSMRRLDDVGPVDDATGQITAGAGTTLQSLQDALRGTGWHHGVDFAARGSATVGGTIATNAGGHHVVRHGMTRRHVVGVEAVLADGSLLSHLGGLVKDNTGYDLPGLLCGSEGTLAVVTRARIALVPDDAETATALVAFATVDAAVAALGPLRRAVGGLEALELMFDEEIASVATVLDESFPLASSPAVLLVEASGPTNALDALAHGIESLDGVVDTAVAIDPSRRAALWSWREHHTETINRLGASPPHKLDVTVPPDRLATFVQAVRPLADDIAPDARVWLFGHAGDGNVHVNITGLAPDDDDVDDAVLRLVAELGGSISAEHGIGRAKRRWLHLCRSPAEIAVFRSIKRGLDPLDLLSPGVLLPDDTAQRS